MQATITGANLRQDLGRIGSALRQSLSKNAAPYASHVALDFRGGQHGTVRMLATDLEFAAMASCDAEVAGPDFEVCLPLSLLHAMLRANPGAPTIADDGSVSFKGGAGYVVNTMPRQDMPAVPPALGETPREIPVPAGPLAQTIIAASGATGGRYDTARMEAITDGLAWVTTDGSRLSWAVQPGVSLPQDWLPALDWPARAMHVLPDFLAGFEVAQIGYAREGIADRSRWTWVRAGDCALYCKTPYNPFPGTWRKIVDLPGYHCLEAATEPLRAALRRACIVDPTMVTLMTKGADLVLEATSNTGLSWSDSLEIMPVRVPLQPIGINPRFLLEAMDEQGVSVVLRYGTPDGAIEVRPSKEDGIPDALRGTSIMPIRRP